MSPMLPPDKRDDWQVQLARLLTALTDLVVSFTEKVKKGK